ncbi:OmpA family protein [Fusibacter bizertensis]
MSEYRFTNRGKFVLTLFILLLVVIIVYSGSYIINFFGKGDSFVATNETASSDETSELTNTSINETEDSSGQVINSTETVETTEAIKTTETTETTVSTEKETIVETTDNVSERLYTVSDLEDLKQFKIIFYFDKGEKKISLDQNDLESIKSMIEQYKGEKIAVVGYTNGYPKFESSEADYQLSLDRAKTIQSAILEMGIEKKLINVYNNGSETPLFSDYGNQNKNDRVEVYFEDHYVFGSRTK